MILPAREGPTGDLFPGSQVEVDAGEHVVVVVGERVG